MRSLGLLALVLASCGTDAEVPPVSDTQSYEFGPFTIQPNQEISDQCVQITLNNETDLYINKVELTTGGPGFHHSNWFFVPAENDATGVVGTFPGPDGVFTCADRSFDQAIAAMRGGVLFAQSTQSQHDLQQFPDGVAIKVPAGSKLVSTIHLLNTGDTTLNLTPKIALTHIPVDTAATLLAGMSFEDEALGLPPNMQSRFTVDCDIGPNWQNLYNLGLVTSPIPDFHIYYALAHYHTLGTAMRIEAGKADGTYSTVFETGGVVGDALGEPIDPTFDMTGYTHIRFSCDYYNSTSQTVGWGIGNQEMCVFLGFSDSTYMWGGGVVAPDSPGPGTLDGNVMTYQHPCMVSAVDSTH